MDEHTLSAHCAQITQSVRLFSRRVLLSLSMICSKSIFRVRNAITIRLDHDTVCNSMLLSLFYRKLFMYTQQTATEWSKKNGKQEQKIMLARLGKIEESTGKKSAF